LRLAELLIQQNEIPEATKRVNEARDLDPENPRVVHLQGRLAYEAGNHDWARSLLLQAEPKLPQDIDVLFDLALSDYSVGKVPEAVARMSRVLAVADDSFGRIAEAKRFVSMAGLHADPTKLKAATAEIDSTLKATPDYLPARIAKAVLYRIEGDIASAKEVCGKILSQFSLFIPAHGELALLYALPPEDWDKAYEHAFKVRQTRQSDPNVAKLLGISLYHRGEFKKSIQLLQECAGKGVSDARWYFYLGMSHDGLKQSKEAKSALQQAVSMGLTAELAAQATKVINRRRN